MITVCHEKVGRTLRDTDAVVEKHKYRDDDGLDPYWRRRQQHSDEKKEEGDVNDDDDDRRPSWVYWESLGVDDDAVNYY